MIKNKKNKIMAQTFDIYSTIKGFHDIKEVLPNEGLTTITNGVFKSIPKTGWAGFGDIEINGNVIEQDLTEITTADSEISDDGTTKVYYHLYFAYYDPFDNKIKVKDLGRCGYNLYNIPQN